MSGDRQRLRQARAGAPVAVIDIGSNSVRLVVYTAATRSPTPLFNEKVLCGLGRALGSSGLLCAEGVERALAALSRFRALADLLGAESVNVVATAAAREAKNGADFIAEAARICGAEIDLLSGKREAALAAAGVAAGAYRPDGLAGDLGGGSLELMDIRHDKVRRSVTLPLGGLRLIDLSEGSLKKAAKLVKEALSSVDWLARGRGRPFYAVGGAWRAFGRLHMAQYGYPLKVMHGYRIATTDALDFANVLDRLTPNSLEGIAEISKARRETVPFGALIIDQLLRLIAPSELIISAYGLREGLLYTLLDDAERARDPLLAACEELAEQRARSATNAHELRRWTDALFAKPGPEESPDERRLRHAACLLSDVGWRVHPDYRGEKSLQLIAHGAFAGIDHPGRAFLALAIFFRHEGMVKDALSPRLIELVDDRTLGRARIVGAALRAAHMISAASPGVIDHTPLSYAGDRLVLSLPERFHMLDGERLRRRFAALGRTLTRDSEVRLTGDAARAAS